jgi:hypothetical protein
LKGKAFKAAAVKSVSTIKNNNLNNNNNNNNVAKKPIALTAKTKADSGTQNRQVSILNISISAKVFGTM